MVRILAVALTASLGLAACTQPVNVAELKPKLRNLITEQMRAHGCSAIRTDEDSRARAPTKYAEATQGLAFSIRHSFVYEDKNVTVSTWVYASQSARDAAKRGPFGAITDDLAKNGLLFRVFNLDSGDLHMIMLMESQSTSLSNQFQLLWKEIAAHLDELKT